MVHPLFSRTLRGALAALVVAAASATPASATVVATSRKRPPSKEEQRIRQLEQQRSQIRATKAKAAAKIDALKATDKQIQAALSDLSDHVASTTARLEDAQRATAAAETELAAAHDAEAKAEAELGELRDRMRKQAVDVFVRGSRDDSWSIYSAASATDATNRKTLLEFRSELNLDSVENYRTVQQSLAAARERAAAASDRAKRQRNAVANRLSDLKSAQAEQQRFAGQVDDRIDASLAEADSLASIDKSLSDQIIVRQGALAQRVAAINSSRSGPRSGGTARVFSTSGGSGIVTVQGIRVASSIASQLDALLNAARAAGIELSGGGYRDPAGQIAVRRSNCGSSNYAIYQAPASSCRPPTARPGSSMHEQGLAIDFTSGGRTLSRGSAGFAWLKAHGGSYGFRNLPSEPWHWSVNGN